MANGTKGQENVAVVAKTLGKDYLLPVILLGMVLYFLHCAMGPVFTATNDSFKKFIEVTEERLVVEERIATILEKQYRREHRDLIDN